MANTSLDGPERRPLSLLVSREGAATLAPQTQPLWHHPSRWDLLVPQRTKPTQRVADFSIRSILAQDGSEGEGETQQEPAEGARWGSPSQGYTWMHCNHFKPTSVPKMKQTGCGPRPPYRSPRVPFSASQLGALESSFQQTHYLSTEQMKEVALLLGLTENRVRKNPSPPTPWAPLHSVALPPPARQRFGLDDPRDPFQPNSAMNSMIPGPPSCSWSGPCPSAL
ncbi:homeobox protein MSX-1-like [Podarcis muralis]